jgi:hypothetical protein
MLGGKGLSGVSVSLSGNGTSKTNSAGSFSFSGVSSGSYTLSGSKTGFSISSQQVSVSNGNISVDLPASDGDAGAEPHIRQHPKSFTVPAGKKVTLRVKAWLSSSKRSSKGLTYQWFKNNSEISEATKNVLKLGATSSATDGSYHVVVTSPFGTTKKSNPATVTAKEGTTTISANFRPKVMKKAKAAGSKIKGLCLVKIRPASAKKELLASGSYEFRIGGSVKATQAGKKGKKYIHTLSADEKNQMFTCTFIDSSGARHDAGSGISLKVQ